jgi:Domain of unknown function (DUF5666)
MVGMKLSASSWRLLVVAALGLLAACGSSVTLNQAPAGNGRSSAVRGITTGVLSHINGGTLTVTARNGAVTVTTSSSTKVTVTKAASISDVSNGQCASVSGQPDTGGTVAAMTVNIMPTISGTCSPPSALSGGLRNGATPPSGGGGGFGVARIPRTSGTVSNVSSNGFTLKESSGTSVSVTASSNTTFTQASSESVSSLNTGVCLVVMGQPQSNSAIAAASITVTAAGASGCSRGFAGGGGFGGGPGGGGFGSAGGFGGGSNSNSGGNAPVVGA